MVRKVCTGEWNPAMEPVPACSGEKAAVWGSEREDSLEAEAWSGNRDVSGRGRRRKGCGSEGGGFGRGRGGSGWDGVARACGAGGCCEVKVIS
jgi:hypothetical protein